MSSGGVDLISVLIIIFLLLFNYRIVCAVILLSSFAYGRLAFIFFPPVRLSLSPPRSSPLQRPESTCETFTYYCLFVIYCLDVALPSPACEWLILIHICVFFSISLVLLSLSFPSPRVLIIFVYVSMCCVLPVCFSSMLHLYIFFFCLSLPCPSLVSLSS